MINVVGAAQEPEEKKANAYTVFVPNTKSASASPTSPAPETPSTPAPSHFTPTAQVLAQADQLSHLANSPAPITPNTTQSTATPVATTPPNTTISITQSAPRPEAPIPGQPSDDPVDNRKKRKVAIIAALAVVGVLLVGGGVAQYLLNSNQDIRQQASTRATPTAIPNRRAATPTPSPTAAPTPSATPTPTLTPGQSATESASPLSKINETNPELSASTSAEENLLALAITPSPTLLPTTAPTTIPTATPTPAGLTDTTTHCNETCLVDANCQNPSHLCHEGQCRLTQNLESKSCELVSGGTMVTLNQAELNRTYTPYAEPSGEGPVSGPLEWGMMGLGGLALLLLGGLALAQL